MDVDLDFAFRLSELSLSSTGTDSRNLHCVRAGYDCIMDLVAVLLESKHHDRDSPHPVRLFASPKTESELFEPG